MTREELNNELKRLGIPSGYYSLYGSLTSDSLIIHHSYHEWQVFYLDERGGRKELKTFRTECEACEYLYERLKRLKETNDTYGIPM